MTVTYYISGMFPLLCLCPLHKYREFSKVYLTSQRVRPSYSVVLLAPFSGAEMPVKDTLWNCYVGFKSLPEISALKKPY